MPASRSNLIAAGVRNLREFGYPTANHTNILTSDVFKRFFASMLKDNLGQDSDVTIKALLAELGEKDRER